VERGDLFGQNTELPESPVSTPTPSNLLLLLVKKVFMQSHKGIQRSVSHSFAGGAAPVALSRPLVKSLSFALQVMPSSAGGRLAFRHLLNPWGPAETRQNTFTMEEHKGRLLLVLVILKAACSLLLLSN